MEHEQFEILIAAILTAGLAGRQAADGAQEAVPLFAKTLEELRQSGVIVKRNAAFIPKNAR